MAQAQCIKYPVKPGHRETLINWITRLEGRSAELWQAMTEGGLVAEAVFLERSDSGDYILIYTRARDLGVATEALSNSNLPLIQEFNRVLADNVDLEKAISLDLIYHTP